MVIFFSGSIGRLREKDFGNTSITFTSYKFDYRSERLPRSFSLAKTENFRRTVDWFSGDISLNFHD